MKRRLLALIVISFCTSMALAAETSREMTFGKRYLNMPVKHGSAKRLLSVIIDGQKAREFVIELADGQAADQRRRAGAGAGRRRPDARRQPAPI